MAFSHMLRFIVLIELSLLEPGLCQGSVEVVVTTPASLQEQIRSEIDSALSNFTCDIKSSPPPPDPCRDTCTNEPSVSNAENVTEMVIRDITAIKDQLDILQQGLNTLLNVPGSSPGSSQSYPASSCAGILQERSNAPSGYYWVTTGTGSVQSVYCDMTRSCGGVTGGWMRVAYLDMTNSSHQCPSSLLSQTDSGVRTCAVLSDSGSCSSVYYPSHGIHYSKVCGKIRGYNIRSLNGFYGANSNIDSIYVEGVSLTYGRTNCNRQHIWSFAVYFRICPCGTPPAFVGNHYFCDSAHLSGLNLSDTINLDSPLWDGEGCGSNCCTNNPPWFYRQLSQTNEDIEMRLCRGSSRSNEDIAVGAVEIYVQ